MWSSSLFLIFFYENSFFKKLFELLLRVIFVKEWSRRIYSVHAVILRGIGTFISNEIVFLTLFFIINSGTLDYFCIFFLFYLKIGLDVNDALSNGDFDSYKFWILVGIMILFDFA